MEPTCFSQIKAKLAGCTSQIEVGIKMRLVNTPLNTFIITIFTLIYTQSHVRREESRVPIMVNSLINSSSVLVNEFFKFNI